MNGINIVLIKTRKFTCHICIDIISKIHDTKIIQKNSLQD